MKTTVLKPELDLSTLTDSISRVLESSSAFSISGSCQPTLNSSSFIRPSVIPLALAAFMYSKSFLSISYDAGGMIII